MTNPSHATVAFVSFWLLAGLSGCRSSPVPDESAAIKSPAQALVEPARESSVRIPIVGRFDNRCPCCVLPSAVILDTEADKKAHPNCGLKHEPFVHNDLTENDAVLLTLGRQDIRGWWIRVDGIEQIGTTLHVRATVNAPGDFQTTPGPVHPYSLVLIPETDADQVEVTWTRIEGSGYVSLEDG